jgi:ethanolamine ammonia-lyase small subunit
VFGCVWTQRWTCDGLSATAVARHAPAVLALAIPALRAQGLPLTPVVVAQQGCVALGDDIGEAFAAAVARCWSASALA